MVELTNTEQMIMKCLWKLNTDSCVSDLLNELKVSYGKEYARTTISVFMSYLRDKGYVSYEKRGHAYVYRPLVSEELYQRELTKQYVSDLFNGNLERAVTVMLDVAKPDKEQTEKLAVLINSYNQ